MIYLISLKDIIILKHEIIEYPSMNELIEKAHELRERINNEMSKWEAML